MKEGDPLSKMYVVRVGEVTCTSKGKVLPMQEAGGFSRFGEQNLVVSPLQLITRRSITLMDGQTQPARLKVPAAAMLGRLRWRPLPGNLPLLLHVQAACYLVARPIDNCVRPWPCQDGFVS